jgi:hypothetical protein
MYYVLQSRVYASSPGREIRRRKLRLVNKFSVPDNTDMLYCITTSLQGSYKYKKNVEKFKLKKISWSCHFDDKKHSFYPSWDLAPPPPHLAQQNCLHLFYISQSLFSLCGKALLRNSSTAKKIGLLH